MTVPTPDSAVQSLRDVLVRSYRNIRALGVARNEAARLVRMELMDVIVETINADKSSKDLDDLLNWWADLDYREVEAAANGATA